MAAIPYPSNGTASGIGTVFSCRSTQAWARQIRLGGIRLSGSSLGRTGGRFALGGSCAGFGDPVNQGSGIDAAVGNPAPSLRLCGNGRRAFALKVTAGSRTVFCDALQSDSRRARPTMRVLANSAVGVASDIVVTAAASAGWVTMSSGALTITANGGLWIEVVNPEPRYADVCYFDNIFIQ